MSLSMILSTSSCLLVALFSAAVTLDAQVSPNPPARTKSGAAKPKPTSTAAPDSTVAPKGFARIDVTPKYKDEFQADRRVAVVVAPSYRNSGLNALRYTFMDAQDLKAELNRQGYTVRLVNPSEATADNIRNAISEVKQLLDGNNQGTFVFAFSGHGFQTSKGNYLVTVGATKDTVETEALSLEDVQTLLNKSGARRKILLVDACRNDLEAKSSDSPGTFKQFQEAEGTSILLSTRPGGFSYEDSDLGHGIFTYYVLEGLRGKAASKDGYVTFFDLQRYVETKVVAQALKKDRVQRPFVMGERSGDFLLATAGKAKPEEIPVAPAGSQLIDSNSLVLREIGGTRSYFAIVTGTKLTLVDSKTLNPFVELMALEKNDLDGGMLHYRGNIADKEILDASVEFNKNDIVGLKARRGTPCKDGKPCSTLTQVPLLPGEKRNQSRTLTGAVSSAAGTARDGLARLGIGRGHGQKEAGTTKVAAETTGSAIDNVNDLLKFQWKNFDLTANTLPLKK